MSHDTPRTVDPAAVTVPPGHRLTKVPAIALGVALVFTVASVVVGLGDRTQLAFSWLVAFVYFLSFALGAMIFVLIQFAARAGWSVLVRRLAENVMGTIPVFVALFLPVALLVHDLYHWTHEDVAAHDAILARKAPYLNLAFFLVRAAVYFLAWCGIALWFRKKSVEQDTTADQGVTRRLQRLAGPSIVVFAFTTTFAAFDWIMGVDPHWYSTIFGGYFFAGSLVALLAFLTIALMALQANGILTREITAEHYHDLGKLLFAFTVFWAYIAFSQFMLIWYGNIPEETVWYAKRFTGNWYTLSRVLLVGHFVVPFLYLMPRTVKRHRPTLLLGALWLLAMHYLDVYWLIMPVHHPEGAHLGLTDVACFLAVGGYFVAAFARLTCRAPVVPLKDPRLPESLAFENA